MSSKTTALCVILGSMTMAASGAFAQAPNAGAKPAATPATPAAPAKAPAASDEKGDKVDLRPKYKTGQTVKFTQHIMRKDTQSIKNGDAEPLTGVTSVDQTVEYTMKVDGASESGTSISLELTSMVVKAEIPQGKFEWDSSTPPDDKDVSNPVIMAFKPIIGTITQVNIGPDGNITEVKPDPRMVAQKPGVLTPFVTYLSGSDQTRIRWGSILSIKDGAEPAAIGSSWSNSEFLNAAALNGKFEFVGTNTLKGVKDGMAEIGIAGDIKLTPIEKDRDMAGKLKDVTASGAAVWDTKAGLAKSYSWSQVYTLDANLNSMSVVRKTEQKSETTRKD